MVLARAGDVVHIVAVGEGQPVRGGHGGALLAPVYELLEVARHLLPRLPRLLIRAVVWQKAGRDVCKANRRVACRECDSICAREGRRGMTERFRSRWRPWAITGRSNELCQL